MVRITCKIKEEQLNSNKMKNLKVLINTAIINKILNKLKNILRNQPIEKVHLQRIIDINKTSLNLAENKTGKFKGSLKLIFIYGNKILGIKKKIICQIYL